MKKIESFSINHDLLNPGIYISKIDKDVVTYDLRMKKPNAGRYLDNAALHTIEHLLASYLRGSSLGESVVYVGPMGCRTGFYLLLRSTITQRAVIRLVQEAFSFISKYDDEIPGGSRIECGNYLNQDLPGARVEAEEYCRIISSWTEEQLNYRR
ncbi:MAG: S-ribosylhomocysteine lyase [Ruminobacter sp.]|jgi:S-ribosylhomocysteine lyase|uniref:S-ribosylhomocysteine lyase n=1 Tax=Ruminobacter amylophilus TaxID=867 RepID=A0A662ZJ22_9GAMM|nr:MULTISPECIES: S-ribosylhomocysteine lyase [Ruminobacter]MBQ3775730.1 S-ribosylhomocysteine lyase [Ruminobacter sp.]SFP57975.1 S-ribosylhomocysteine lyase /quorum-sensing autoinducer 2 (AI-2) synthesis protein LuxS [Ruminobacter amylophilus]